MILGSQVLRCCSFEWQDPKSIAMKFDDLYPPEWYSVIRNIRLALEPEKPSVDLHFILEILVKQGRLKTRFDAGKLCYVYRLKDRHYSKPRRGTRFLDHLPVAAAA